MWLTKSKQKYRYVEIGKYIEKIDRFVRLMEGPKNNRRPIVIDVEDVEAFRNRNKNFGLYTSVFHYDRTDVDNAVCYGPLYFDFDSEKDISLAQRDARKVYEYFSDFIEDDQMRLYFTGSKGFHLEIEPVTLGIDPSISLAKYYNFIAERLNEKFSLDTLDFKVYDSRRMWRLKESIHQKTGLYKNELPKRALTSSVDRILDYCKQRRPHEAPKPTLSVDGTEWYKTVVATFEAVQEREEQQRAEKRAQLFAEHGSKLAGSRYGTAYLDRIWGYVLENLQEAERGSRNDTLYRSSFRMFMAVQRVGAASEDVEEKLLAVATDIGLGTIESKATINSALKGAKQAYQNDPMNGIL